MSSLFSMHKGGAGNWLELGTETLNSQPSSLNLECLKKLLKLLDASALRMRTLRILFLSMDRGADH